MWILHFLPDAFILWFCNILLLTGVVAVAAGFFAHRIPGLWQYQLLFKITGIALLVLGVYFRGGVAVETEWRQRVAEVEARLAQAEKAAAEANTKINARAQQRTAQVRERTQLIRQYVDREVVKYDSGCTIPQSFVRAHNTAAEAPAK
jgi:membrane protein implicated in regulation of membrane protease activity